MVSSSWFKIVGVQVVHCALATDSAIEALARVVIMGASWLRRRLNLRAEANNAAVIGADLHVRSRQPHHQPICGHKPVLVAIMHCLAVRPAAAFVQLSVFA